MVLSIGSITALVLAALVIIGGIIGFAKAQSIASLIAGVVSAALLGGCVFLMSLNQGYGLIAAIVVAGILEGIFFVRLRKTKKFMPAGLMIGASALSQVLFIVDLVTSNFK